MKGYLIKIDEDIWRRVKSKAASQGITLKQLIEELLLKWLED